MKVASLWFEKIETKRNITLTFISIIGVTFWFPVQCVVRSPWSHHYINLSGALGCQSSLSACKYTTRQLCTWFVQSMGSLKKVFCCIIIVFLVLILVGLWQTAFWYWSDSDCVSCFVGCLKKVCDHWLESLTSLNLYTKSTSQIIMYRTVVQPGGA